MNTVVLDLAGVAGRLWLIADAAGDTADRYRDSLDLQLALDGVPVEAITPVRTNAVGEVTF